MARIEITPELLDRKQTADFLGISIRNLETKTAGGEIPGFLRVWNQPRWSRSAIQEWINSGCPDLQEAASSGNERQSEGPVCAERE